MSLLRAVSLVAAVSFLPAVSNAAEPGGYVGASYVDASPDLESLANSYDVTTIGDSDGFKLIAGYQFLDWLAAEANYADLGEASGNVALVCIPEVECPGDFDIDIRALSIGAIASIDVGPVDFFARAGLAHWDADVNFSGVGAANGIDGTDPVYGVGIRVHVKSLALRLEFERQELDDSSVDQISLGATYSFGR